MYINAYMCLYVHIHTRVLAVEALGQRLHKVAGWFTGVGQSGSQFLGYFEKSQVRPVVSNTLASGP